MEIIGKISVVKLPKSCSECKFVDEFQRGWDCMLTKDINVFGLYNKRHRKCILRKFKEPININLRQTFKECGYCEIKEDDFVKRSDQIFDYNDMMLFAEAIIKKTKYKK